MFLERTGAFKARNRLSTFSPRLSQSIDGVESGWTIDTAIDGLRSRWMEIDRNLYFCLWLEDILPRSSSTSIKFRKIQNFELRFRKMREKGSAFESLISNKCGFSYDLLQ